MRRQFTARGKLLRLLLEKVQGATRLGATRLSASEREICLWERLWEELWKTLKHLWKPLKISENLWKPPLTDPLRGPCADAMSWGFQLLSLSLSLSLSEEWPRHRAMGGGGVVKTLQPSNLHRRGIFSAAGWFEWRQDLFTDTVLGPWCRSLFDGL